MEHQVEAEVESLKLGEEMLKWIDLQVLQTTDDATVDYFLEKSSLDIKPLVLPFCM